MFLAQKSFHMKKGRWLLILSIIVLVVSFLPLHLFLPGLFVETGTYDLAPGNVNGPSLFMPLGTVAVLDLNVDGANRDVYFYITGSSAERVFDAGRVYSGYHLVWTSTSFSSFRFNFDNTMSWVSHKQVSYTIQIYPYATILLFLGIVLFLVALWQIMREENVFSRIKGFLFKKPESPNVTCEYCGGTYNKTLDKCPHCGARKTNKPLEKKQFGFGGKVLSNNNQGC
jgi:hypothetical protein